MIKLKNILDHIRRAEYKQALDLFNTFIEKNEGELLRDALGHRAWLLSSIGKYEEAVADYERLLTLTPQDDIAKAHMAYNLCLLGDIEQAREIAFQLLERNIENYVAIEVLRKCYYCIHGDEGKENEVLNDQFIDLAEKESTPQNDILTRLNNYIHADFASVSNESSKFIYGLTRFLQPSIVFEIGSFVGYSSLHIAQALKDNRQGHLHSFDLFTAKPKRISPIADDETDLLTVARKHCQAAKLDRWITFHKGVSYESIKYFFNKTPQIKIDFAFIDGDHSIKGCLKDWRVIDQHLCEDGFVLLHDTNPENCPHLGPRYLIEKLKENDFDHYQVISFPSPPDYVGLALIQKQSKKLSHNIFPTWQEVIKDYIFSHANWREI